MADIDIKFPTMDEFAKEVAEKALDEFLYDGKSIREWIQIIASEDVISRQAVIDALNKTSGIRGDALKALYELPPVIPQEFILDKIYADIQRLRGCSCSCSDGIIDDVEDIIDKYRGEVDCRECKAEYECYYCKKYEESEGSE